MTGNFYCVPSSCAKIVYREYLPPVVRWRYEGEDWQEIIGADSYTTEKERGKCDTEYNASGKFEAAYKFRNPDACRGLWDWYSNPNNPIPGKIIGWTEIVFDDFNSRWAIIFETSAGNQGTYTNINDLIFRTEITNVTNCNQSGSKGWKGGYFSIDEIERVDGLPDDCGDCIFKVFQEETVVYEEKREKCPEVENLPLRLSDEYKEITIEKLAYLQRVEVRNQDISTFFLPPLDTPFTSVESLPENCLNIYLTVVAAPPFLQETVPLPGAVNPYEFIAQICSEPELPPPEYTVICDCDPCESCPDGTCPVECDNHICCYDTTTGIAVKSIPLDEYCGG
ncbi:MAG: hypothetical protein QNJ72_39410 [Pleurocapsa sp. MO_226.B13]|nr:hypothetical protein [Pleurocapsa sp. MO_226.B13]